MMTPKTDFDAVYPGGHDLPSEIDTFNSDNVEHYVKDKFDNMKKTIISEKARIEKAKREQVSDKVITASLMDGD